MDAVAFSIAMASAKRAAGCDLDLGASVIWGPLRRCCRDHREVVRVVGGCAAGERRRSSWICVCVCVWHARRPDSSEFDDVAASP